MFNVMSTNLPTVTNLPTMRIMTEQDGPIDGQHPNLGRKVRELLKWSDPKNRLSVRVAARKTKLSHATIANMARGDRPKMGLLIQFAQGMNVPINEVLAAADYPPLSLTPMLDPLSRLGRTVSMTQLERTPVSLRIASAGEMKGLGDAAPDEEMASTRIPEEARGIELDGDCMEPFFRKGDIVFIDPRLQAENGQKIVALLNDDSLTCKVFRQDNTGAHLEATNGKYPRIDAPDFTILGVVVKVLKDV